MSEENLTKLKLNTIANLSQGNPGALQFLFGLYEWKERTKAAKVLSFLVTQKVKGTRLYILFSDLCDRDYDKVYQLATKCPKDVLLEACRREDRSGKEWVKEYFD